MEIRDSERAQNSAAFDRMRISEHNIYIYIYIYIYVDTLNIKGVEILRGARVGVAMYFLSIQRKKASCICRYNCTSTGFV